MATNEIKLGINLRQNKNARNSGYGKYYPEIDTQTTLSLRGFAKHMSDHGSIYSLDIIEGVLKKITQCLPELISQGVPVRMEPLGTFLPTCDVEKPILNIAAMENADPNEVVLNANISKSWSNATLTLKGYDLLNQKKSIVQVIGENYVQYKEYNSLQTYVMLTFTYKLNRMGGMKAKGMAGHIQDMMESGRTPGKGGVPPMGPPPDR